MLQTFPKSLRDGDARELPLDWFVKQQPKFHIHFASERPADPDRAEVYRQVFDDNKDPVKCFLEHLFKAQVANEPLPSKIKDGRNNNKRKRGGALEIRGSREKRQQGADSRKETSGI